MIGNRHDRLSLDLSGMTSQYEGMHVQMKLLLTGVTSLIFVSCAPDENSDTGKSQIPTTPSPVQKTPPDASEDIKQAANPLGSYAVGQIDMNNFDPEEHLQSIVGGPFKIVPLKREDLNSRWSLIQKGISKGPWNLSFRTMILDEDGGVTFFDIRTGEEGSVHPSVWANSYEYDESKPNQITFSGTDFTMHTIKAERRLEFLVRLITKREGRTIVQLFMVKPWNHPVRTSDASDDRRSPTKSHPLIDEKLGTIPDDDTIRRELLKLKE